MANLSFKPQTITRRLIGILPERAQDVINKRFGLDKEGKTMTLEAIGSIYGITRERVRQIEAQSLKKLSDSDVLEEFSDNIAELRQTIHDLGIIIPEQELLGAIAPRQDVQNHIYLLLNLGQPFERERENRHFTHRWYVDRSVAEAVKNALVEIHKKLSPEDLVSEKEMVDMFLKNLDTSVTPEQHIQNEETLRRWLRLSKVVDKNPLGEWGLATSPSIRVKGIRDYAYLVIRSHGSPMHFTEVTKRIQDMFGKKAHVATTHNELIKDGRFVLVGRGLYALTEWGYMQGVVKDVIQKILQKEGPLTKDEVVDRVLRERYVKPNTVIVNLQDGSMFKKTPDGRYELL